MILKPALLLSVSLSVSPHFAEASAEASMGLINYDDLGISTFDYTCESKNEGFEYKPEFQQLVVADCAQGKAIAMQCDEVMSMIGLTEMFGITEILHMIHPEGVEELKHLRKGLNEVKPTCLPS